MRAVLCAALAGAVWSATVVESAETWTEVRSPNFRVVTNAGAKQGREVVANFERLKGVLQTVSQISTRSDVPLTIVALQSGRQLRTMTGTQRDNLAGLFAPGPDVNLVILRLDLEREERYQVAYHEYMHVLVRQTIGVVPNWLNEGRAEMYSQARLETDEVLLGMPANYHLAALQERSLLPLETLLAVDNDSPYYTEDNRATVFYAQSWALTHFLMLGDNGAHRPKLFALLEALDAGATPAEATRKALGDVPVFDRQFRGYISRYQFPALKARVPLGDDVKAAPSRSLSPAETLALHATIAATLGNAKGATELSGQAVAADKTLADAWMSQARAARLVNNLPGTQKALAEAIAVGSTDPLAHFGWAELRLQETASTPGPLTDVSTALERSLELKPDLARALSLLGYVQARQDRNTTRGFESIKKAITLEPGNVRHYLLLANIMYNARDMAATEAALARADRVAQGADEKRRVADVRQRIGQKG